ncbi:MAG: hypothetical protein ACTTIM_03490 [Campylobacter sp.]
MSRNLNLSKTAQILSKFALCSAKISKNQTKQAHFESPETMQNY